MVRELPRKSHNFVMDFSNRFVTGYNPTYQTITDKKSRQTATCQLGGPTWARTKDLLIMSQLL